MGRVIVVTSGKGGVGKTTIVANLGIMLATCGKTVCVIDADVGLNNLDVVLGVENKIVYDLVDCVEGKCRPSQALIKDGFLPTLYVLPCCKIYENKHLATEQFAEVVSELKKSFDYLLIDCPAGIGSGFYMSITPADEAIVVSTPHIASVRDADKVIGLLQASGISTCKLVVNRIKRDLVLKREMLSADELESLLQLSVVGIIPESDELGVFNSFLTKSREFNDLGVQYAFGILCKNIIFGKNEKYSYLKKHSRLLKLFKRS